MSTNEVAGIDIRARLDQFAADMAAIPGIGAKEARALTAQLSKEIKAAEAVSKKALEATKATAEGIRKTGTEARKASEGVKAFGDASGKLGSNAAKLAGVLDMLVPGAGELARGLNDMADTGEVAASTVEALGVEGLSLGAIFGPVAIAVAALGTAYLMLSSNAQVAEEAMRRSEAVAEAAGMAAKARTDLQMDLVDQYLMATGYQTAADVKAREAKDRLAATTSQSIGDLKSQKAAAEEAARSIPGLTAEIDRLRIAQESAADSGRKGVDFSGRISVLESQVAAAENLASNIERIDAGIAGIEQRAAQQSTMIDETLRLTKAEEDRRKAEQDASKAEAARAAQTALLTKVDEIAARGMSAAAQAALAYDQEVQALTDEARKAHVSLTVLQPALHQLAQEHAFSAQMAEADAWAQAEFAKRVDPNVAAIKRLNAEIEALAGKTDPATQRTIAFAVAEADLALALSQGTIGLEEYQNQLGKLDAAQAKANGDAAKKAHDIVVQATGTERDAYEKLAEDKAKALSDYLEAARAAGLSEQQVAADTARISSAYAKQAADLQAQQAKDIAEKVSSYATQGLDLLAEALTDSYQVAADSVQRLTEQLAAGQEYYTASQKKELQQRIAAEKDAAQKSFEAQKSARIAEAIITTASAVVNALNAGLAAGGPLGLITGPAAAVSAGVAGAAQIAVIAGEQPSFHKGGPLDLAPDEMSITARRREWMLNPTGRSMYGDQELHRSNAGISPKGGSGSTVAMCVYRHNRMVDTWKADGLQGGDPIAAAIQEGKMTGQRSKR